MDNNIITDDNILVTVYFQHTNLVIKAVDRLNKDKYKTKIKPENISELKPLKSLEILFDMFADLFEKPKNHQFYMDIKYEPDFLVITINSANNYLKQTMEFRLKKKSKNQESLIKLLESNLVSQIKLLETNNQKLESDIKLLESSNQKLESDYKKLENRVDLMEWYSCDSQLLKNLESDYEKIKTNTTNLLENIQPNFDTLAQLKTRVDLLASNYLNLDINSEILVDLKQEIKQQNNKFELESKTIQKLETEINLIKTLIPVDNNLELIEAKQDFLLDNNNHGDIVCKKYDQLKIKLKINQDNMYNLNISSHFVKFENIQIPFLDSQDFIVWADIFGICQNIKNIKIIGNNIICDLSLVNYFNNPETLEITNCENLSDISCISYLTNLEELTILFCPKISHLPCLDKLTKLKLLQINYSTNFEQTDNQFQVKFI